jgi:hypothetical protein
MVWPRSGAAQSRAAPSLGLRSIDPVAADLIATVPQCARYLCQTTAVLSLVSVLPFPVAADLIATVPQRARYLCQMTAVLSLISLLPCPTVQLRLTPLPARKHGALRYRRSPEPLLRLTPLPARQHGALRYRRSPATQPRLTPLPARQHGAPRYRRSPRYEFTEGGVHRGRGAPRIRSSTTAHDEPSAAAPGSWRCRE